MAWDSLTQNEEHDILSKILKNILDCVTLFLDRKYMWFLVHLYVA